MDLSSQGEPREVRAARNQSLFRAVNEQLKTVDPPFEEVASTHVVTCECADLDCIETLEIGRERYAEVRENRRRFVVLDGHVYLDAERLVDAHDGYVVVEKIGTAAGVAEALGAKGHMT